jgi:hypothetical protein
VAPISLALASFFRDEIKGKLIGIEVFCRPGDARALLIEQVRQRACLFLASLLQLRGHCGQSLCRDLLQCRNKVHDILFDQCLDAGHRRPRRFTGITQGFLKLIERLFLAAFA